MATAWQIVATDDFKTDLFWRHSDGSTNEWLRNGNAVQGYGGFGQIPTSWKILV